MSTLPRTSDAYSFHRERSVVPESSGGTRGSADDLVHILGKRKEGSGVSERISKGRRRRTDIGHAHNRLCENSIGALRLGSGRTVKHFILVTPKPVRAEVLEV